MPNEQREAACAGNEVDGSKDQMSAQLMAHDDLGRDWGGPDKNNPAGLLAHADLLYIRLDNCHHPPWSGRVLMTATNPRR